MQRDGNERTETSDGRASLGAGFGQEELTAVLSSLVETRSSREQIRHALRPVCVRARADQVDVAELVKLLKQSFKGGAAATLAHAGERQQVLDRIISVCIDEYFATR